MALILLCKQRIITISSILYILLIYQSIYNIAYRTVELKCQTRFNLILSFICTLTCNILWHYVDLDTIQVFVRYFKLFLTCEGSRIFVRKLLSAHNNLYSLTCQNKLRVKRTFQTSAEHGSKKKQSGYKDVKALCTIANRIRIINKM